jgi:hypothetical protein
LVTSRSISKSRSNAVKFKIKKSEASVLQAKKARKSRRRPNKELWFWKRGRSRIAIRIKNLTLQGPHPCKVTQKRDTRILNKPKAAPMKINRSVAVGAEAGMVDVIIAAVVAEAVAVVTEIAVGTVVAAAGLRGRVVL